MPESDFERQLGTLLRQTAADIPPALDVSARVHQKFSTSGGWHGSRRWVTVASMVAVVALLAGTFTWFRGAGLRLGPGPIALRVDAAYADATATVVTFHLTGPRTDVAYSTASAFLTDAAGNPLPFQSGGGDASGGGSALFAPLPQPALEVRQTLTLTITYIDLIPLHETGLGVPGTSTLKGFWQGRVTVTPIAGTSRTLRIPAQTHCKLSIQPLRLDVSPSSPPGFDYSSGGIRIVLRMSGLTPGTPPAGDFATKDPNPPDGSGASGSGDQTSLSAAGYAGLLPAFVYDLDAQGMPPLSQVTVDASGATEFELIYILSLLPLQGPLTLTFDSITLNSGEKIPGPWVFTIPGT